MTKAELEQALAESERRLDLASQAGWAERIALDCYRDLWHSERDAHKATKAELAEARLATQSLADSVMARGSA